MFQFPGFPLITYGFSYQWLEFVQPGFPIQKSSDQRIFAPPRRLSQLITSFFGSQCQGIHHTLFHAWPVISMSSVTYPGSGQCFRLCFRFVMVHLPFCLVNHLWLSVKFSGHQFLDDPSDVLNIFIWLSMCSFQRTIKIFQVRLIFNLSCVLDCWAVIR